MFIKCNMNSMHLSAMDLNLVTVLHVLLAERNVSRAAKRLGLSQSATSHALARLRATVGDPLLVRSPTGLVPTARAVAMQGALDSSLAEIERALFAEARFDPGTAERAVRVVTSDYAAIQLYPPLVETLGKEAPGISLWSESYTDESRTRLARGEADLMLAPPTPSTRETAASMHEEVIFEETFVCVVRKGHPLTRGKITVQRFAAERHAFIAPGGRPGGVVDEALALQGLRRTVAVAVPHFLLAPHVVAKSDLVLTMGRRLAVEFARMLPLAVLEPPLALPSFAIALHWHARQTHDLAHTYVRDKIRAVARAMAEQDGKVGRKKG